MTATIRRVAPVLIGLLIAGCGATVSPSPVRTSSPSAAAPSLTPVPGAPSPTPATTPPPTSKPEFGPIWDGLPPSWPALPGQSQSEVGTDASDQLITHGKPATLARDLGAALAAAGWSVDVGSPLEDGSVVLDATGSPTGCRAQARFTPNEPDGDPVIVQVYYGAGCPFE